MLLGLLEGEFVSLNTMHCQSENAQSVINAEANYFLSVKANQPTLYDYLLTKFTEFGEIDYSVDGLRPLTTSEKSHDRFERREYRSSQFQTKKVQR